MLHKTRGIALGYIRYKESSIIVRMVTEAFGMQSYIVNGVRSAKAKQRIGLFQPLTLLDLVVYHKQQGGLQRIAEIKCPKPYEQLPFSIQKSSIALFLTEILGKTIKEEAANTPMFEFLWQAFQLLDHLDHSVENFHLQFLLKYGRFLGLGATSAHDIFEELKAVDARLQDRYATEHTIDALLNGPFGNEVNIATESRRTLLNTLLNFYHLQLDGLGQLSTLKVLREVIEG